MPRPTIRLTSALFLLALQLYYRPVPQLIPKSGAPLLCKGSWHTLQSFPLAMGRTFKEPRQLPTSTPPVLPQATTPTPPPNDSNNEVRSEQEEVWGIIILTPPPPNGPQHTQQYSNHPLPKKGTNTPHTLHRCPPPPLDPLKARDLTPSYIIQSANRRPPDRHPHTR